MRCNFFFGFIGGSVLWVINFIWIYFAILEEDAFEDSEESMMDPTFVFVFFPAIIVIMALIELFAVVQISREHMMLCSLTCP